MFKQATEPWNKGVCVGARKAFLPCQMQILVEQLEIQKRYRDLALMTTAIDSMLRSSDLLSLKVADLSDQTGDLKPSFLVKQKKTGLKVLPYLSDKTRRYLNIWIEISGKSSDDYIFTSLRKEASNLPITGSAFRKIIKGFADLLGLDSSEYSGHSLRRTKPSYLFRQGVPIEIIATLLGHQDTKSTLRYLGIDLDQAQQIAVEYDVFSKITAAPKIDSHEVVLSETQLEKLAQLIAITLRQVSIV